MRETIEYFTCPKCRVRSFGKAKDYNGFKKCYCISCGHQFLYQTTEREDKKMLFRRKNKDEIDAATKEVIAALNKRISMLIDKENKLHRIIKYSANEPTFRFGNQEYVRWINSYQLSAGNNLWMYIDKEEYKVYLSELDSVRPDKENCEFKVENDLAYFTILGETRYDTIQKFNFVIDYKKDKYVVTTQEVKKDNSDEG